MAEFSKQFDAMFAGVYLMLGVLAFPSLIAILNSLAIGVIERRAKSHVARDWRDARAGVEDDCGRSTLAFGYCTAFGILAGLYLSYVMVQGMGASGIFKMEYSFPLAGVLSATAVGLIFGVIAALLPARQASSMEIVKALRYE